jgi:hypothetical protein
MTASNSLFFSFFFFFFFLFFQLANCKSMAVSKILIWSALNRICLRRLLERKKKKEL